MAAKKDNAAEGLNGPIDPCAQSVLVGHEQAEHTLLDTYLAETLPHAWILAGPPGIGKATLAYRFARFLFRYPVPDDARAAGAADFAVAPDYPAFRQVAAGAHPDIFVVARTIDEKSGRLRGEIRAEEVRGAGGFFARTSGTGGWRVCIIDAADDMNRTAANALLKMLEEPPERSLFLLVANAPGRLLPTIRSRCRLLRLQPLAREALLEGLGSLAPALDETRAARAADIADGSLGLALQLAAGNGLEIYERLLALLGSLPELDARAVVELADMVGGRQAMEDYRLFCRLFGGWIARAVRASATGALNELGADERDLVARLRMAEKHPDWAQAWSQISRSIQRANALNLDRKQVVLNAFLELEAAARASMR